MNLQAQVLAFANTIGALLIAFNVALTQTQLGGVLAVVNAGYALGYGVYLAYQAKKKPKPAV